MKRIKYGTKVTVQTNDMKVYTGIVKRDTGRSLTVQISPKVLFTVSNQNIFTLSF